MRAAWGGRGRTAVGLDLGTTKIAAVIAERDSDGAVKVVGVGSSPSEGLRRGVIVDVEKTVHAIRRALEAAELMAGVEVQEVLAGIAGEHVSSCNSRGVVAVSGTSGEVSPRDKERVIEAARAVSLAGGRQVLHVLPQEFFVDGQGGIRDPVGIAGVRLEADVHLVTGAATAVQNIRNTITRAGCTVRELVLEPLAASHAVLDEDEREMGVCLIDIGGGTTDVALFSLGAIRHTSVLGLGGQNVTNDVAVGLRTSWSLAEQIKCSSGTAVASQIADGEVIEVPGVAGRLPRSIPRQEVASIIGMRMEEIFGLVREELHAAGLDQPLGAGVVLTGGGALIEGVAELAEQVFRMPVRIGNPVGVCGLVDRVSSPVFAAAVGLARYGLMDRPSGSDEGRQRRPAAQRAGAPWWRAVVEWVSASF